MSKYPKVGVGALIFNQNNQILLGERIHAHGSNSYGPPGGHLEFGESFEQCAIREVFEETGLNLCELKYLATTNDIFIKEQKHYVSIFMKAWIYTTDQEIVVKEPNKISSWQWFDLDCLPENMFLPLKNLLKFEKLNLYDK